MAQDQGFVVRVVLSDRGTGDEPDESIQVFVTEYEPDIEGIQKYALAAGWPTCDVETKAVPLLGGDGATEIAQWITDVNRRETANDPSVARMNKIERDVNSLAKGQHRIEALLAQMIEGAKSAGGVVRRVPDAELERAAYVAGARLPQDTQPRDREEQTDVDHQAGEPKPTGRRDVPMRTPEMRGDPDFRSNSMATLGAPASSKIFSYEAGSDEDGLPKPAPMSRVGDTLHKGTRLG